MSRTFGCYRPLNDFDCIFSGWRATVNGIELKSRDVKGNTNNFAKS